MSLTKHYTELRNIKNLLTREGLVRDIGAQWGERLPVTIDKQIYFASKSTPTLP
jgi:hypothetical protein